MITFIMKSKQQHHFDIFELQRDIQEIYRKTGAKEVLTKYGKVKYFYLALGTYVVIGLFNITFSTIPIFFPDVLFGFNKYVALASFTTTFIAIFITKKIVDIAMIKVIKKKSSILMVNRHNVPIRYLHFKYIFMRNERLCEIEINKVIQWRMIDNNDKEKESLLKTPWFIPSLSVLIALVPFETQARIDISIMLANILVMGILAFYVFIGMDENKNIDKFLAWLQLEHDTGTSFTNKPSYYFISVKPLSQESADLKKDIVQADEIEAIDEYHSIK
ncbi:hypothetical protein [Aeromonas hydrophila]|uniref:hypothetical protein n=2 Tax=Aeromonas hydrophila TaxID=644 RepID=UPI00057548BF|nr:hypothetical protein [Aeromonas hydrophila]KHN56804.1 hypothetical protein OI72_12375 [Aeromonas hydrophila]OFC45112.1 hypothetical protein BA189_16820 [Aeromonas hydrophila]OFC49318.1 hypothetical protein BA188_03330 [Aeromonas hydrophila]